MVPLPGGQEKFNLSHGHSALAQIFTDSQSCSCSCASLQTLVAENGCNKGEFL